MYKIKYKLGQWEVQFYDDHCSCYGWQVIECHKTQEDAILAVKELKKVSQSKNVQDILKEYGY